MTGRLEGLRYRRLAAWPRALVIIAVIGLATLGHAQAPPPNVLLVTIDTVRADHIGAYGDAKASTPTLDRLARDGVRFADATTQAPLTGPAHTAILTGMYPARFGIRDNATTPLPSSATTIAELFKARGYRTGAFVGAFILDRQYGFAQGFDDFDSRFERFSSPDKLQARRTGGEVADDAIAWLGRTGSQPFFAWVHLYDAHAPYEPPAPFSSRFKSSPYDGAIAYVDATIGRIVAALEQRNALDRTVVAVLADHGEGLGDHGEREHGFLLYDSVLRIPWILRLPGRAHAGGVVKDQVRAIDVLPTVVALAGGTAPHGLDGESAVPLIEGGTRRDAPPSYAETYYGKLHFGWSDLKSVRVGDYKFIDAPKPELYDVRRDAPEQRNLVDARGTLANGLSTELRKIDVSFGAAAPSEAPQPDAETMARLRSLGYVGMTSPSSSVGRGADPKDMIAGVERFREAMGRATTALAQRRPSAALPILSALVKENEQSYEVHLALGDAYLGLQQYPRAIDEYAAAALLNPPSAEPVLAAARAYLAQGDAAKAAAKVSEAERLEPGTADVLIVKGTVRERQGRAADAIAAYTEAVRANGSDTQARVHLAALALQGGQLDTARAQFEALLRMQYRPSRMHFGLGQVAQAQGDAARAEAEYRESLKLEPTFAEARAALARLGRTP